MRRGLWRAPLAPPAASIVASWSAKPDMAVMPCAEGGVSTPRPHAVSPSFAAPHHAARNEHHDRIVCQLHGGTAVAAVQPREEGARHFVRRISGRHRQLAAIVRVAALRARRRQRGQLVGEAANALGATTNVSVPGRASPGGKMALNACHSPTDKAGTCATERGRSAPLMKR